LHSQLSIKIGLFEFSARCLHKIALHLCLSLVLVGTNKMCCGTSPYAELLKLDRLQNIIGVA